MRRMWTDEELKILRAEYPNTCTTKLAKKLKRTSRSVYTQANIMRLKKDEVYMLTSSSGRWQKGEVIGKATQFKKGQAAWNKNTKGLTFRNKTSFCAGVVPPNYKPVGSTRIDSKDGYILIKIADPNKWQLLHRKVWEDNHGKIPPRHTIIFLDGNKQNCLIENLAIISREENMLRNTIHRYPEEIKDAIKTLTKLKKTIKNHGTK